MKLAERVTICEVGTRDGFQIEPEFIPTELKIEVVDRLSATGLPRIEVTSFVSPKAVPMLRDAEAVMAGINRRPGTRYSALVPNDKGAVRAVDAGVDDIHTVLSASESHNLANVNMTIAESLARLEATAQVAHRAGKPVYAGISCSFGCPFEGEVPVARLESVVRRLVDLGAMGVETGIDLDALIETSKRVQEIVGRVLPGQIVKAGAWTRRYPLPDGVRERVPARS